MMIVCLAFVCNVPVQKNSIEMMKKSPEITLTILILLVGILMVTKSLQQVELDRKKVQIITATEDRSDCVRTWMESVNSLKQQGCP